MPKRIKKIRRELDKRRRSIDRDVYKREKMEPTFLSHRQHVVREGPSYSQKYDDYEPQEIKSFFLFRVLTAACLFFIILILFHSAAPQFNGVKQFVHNVYEKEFQFATIANWYENQFGKPIVLIPQQSQVAQGNVNEPAELVYAMPAAGIIREDFEKNGRGILIETGKDTHVEAVRGGYVIKIGESTDDNLGKVVTVQHYDGTESIYGMLNKISIHVYDHIEAGDKIGTVSTNDQTDDKGIFYFAMKKDGVYIDPSKVLSFE